VLQWRGAVFRTFLLQLVQVVYLPEALVLVSGVVFVGLVAALLSGLLGPLVLTPKPSPHLVLLFQPASRWEPQSTVPSADSVCTQRRLRKPSAKTRKTEWFKMHSMQPLLSSGKQIGSTAQGAITIDMQA